MKDYVPLCPPPQYLCIPLWISILQKKYGLSSFQVFDVKISVSSCPPPPYSSSSETSKMIVDTPFGESCMGDLDFTNFNVVCKGQSFGSDLVGCAFFLQDKDGFTSRLSFWEVL
ncbi:hypothetical protein SESBI_16372 [Sesbania bispinosa]|nr:hypothetical protein SESBI_16372 [Sesbania bispinosa]